MSLLGRLLHSPPPDAGSLQAYMKRLDDLEERFRLAVDCYREAIEGVARRLPKKPVKLFEEQRRELRKLREGLAGDPERPALLEARDRLAAEIDAAGARLEEFLAATEQDAKQVLAAMAVMAESMAAREKEYGVRFRGIARKLRRLTTANDLAEIRRRLNEEVTQLERYVEDMEKDTRAAVERVQTEADTLRRRQAPPPEEAAPDRPMVCVLRFVLETPLEGRLAGGAMTGALLEQFASRVRLLFRESDVVCRWRGQELLAVAGSQPLDVAERAAEIEGRLSGIYQALGCEVPVRAEARFEERVPGEAAHHVLNRLMASANLAGRGD